jgi:predicted MFS family arabinose efflux permease
VLLAFASVFATQAFLGPIADATLKTSPALLQAMIAAGALAGVPVGAALAERAANAPAAVAGALLAAALWQWGLLAGDLHSPLLQCGQVALASAALFAVSPVLQARLVAAAPHARTLVLAANFVAVSLGQGIGAGLGGLALGTTGLVSAAAVGVLAAAAMLILATRRP